jgi:hypothetical protein
MAKVEVLLKDPLPLFFQEVKKVSDNQRSIVIITHGFIELLINTIIEARCKHGKKKITTSNRDYPHSVKLVLLNELGILDDCLFRILDWFRKVRNKAAHEPFFKLSPADLDFANKSLGRFIPDHPPLKNNELLNRFCVMLVATIWNGNLDELVPAFTPSLVKKNG